MQSELTVDGLAQEIRRVDGNHSLGAGALAEALMPFLSALSDKQAGEVKIKPLEWTTSWGPDQDGDECHTAGTPFGNFSVERYEGRWRWRYCFDEYYDEDSFDCDDLESGKIAAQNHWVERLAPFLSALVDVPAVEPVAWLHPTAQWASTKRDRVRVHCLNDGPQPIPLYTHPPLREGEDSAGGIDKARALATAILQNFGDMEDGNGGEAPELAMARDLLAATRSASATTARGHAVSTDGQP